MVCVVVIIQSQTDKATSLDDVAEHEIVICLLLLFIVAIYEFIFKLPKK